MSNLTEIIRQQMEELERLRKKISLAKEVFGELDEVFCQRCPVCFKSTTTGEADCPSHMSFGDDLCLVRVLFEHSKKGEEEG